jgi:hypothetical protein
MIYRNQSTVPILLSDYAVAIREPTASRWYAYGQLSACATNKTRERLVILNNWGVAHYGVDLSIRWKDG